MEKKLPFGDSLLLITSDFPPISGGQSKHLYNLWANISSQEVLVLAPLAEDSQYIDDAFTGKVIRRWIPLGGSWRARLLRPFVFFIHTLKIIRKTDINCIHCWQVLSGGFVGYLINLIYNIPYFVYINGADLLEFKEHFPWASLLNKILRQAKKICVNSHYTQELVRGLGIDQEKINLVYPAIDPELYSQQLDSNSLRQRWGLSGKRLILTVGRLVERKGHDMVIQVLSEIIKEFSEVHYLVVGDGPYKEKLQGLVKRLDLEKHVTFTGFVPEEKLPAYYDLCQIFVMPSREIPSKGDVEGFGIVYLEANAAAKPVIAGKAGGVEDAVIHGLNGLLVDPCSIAEIKEAILTLLQQDSLRETLGINGKHRVTQEFNWKKRAADFEKIISQPE